VRYRFKETEMARTAVVAAIWFALWMAAGALYGGLTAPPARGVGNGVWSGITSGAFIAVITSFAWPWILPERVDRWMRRGEIGEA
jgi:hypothetical protein